MTPRWYAVNLDLITVFFSWVLYAIKDILPGSPGRSIFPFMHYLHTEGKPLVANCLLLCMCAGQNYTWVYPTTPPPPKHSEKLSALGLFSHFVLLLAQHPSPKGTWKLALDSV